MRAESDETNRSVLVRHPNIYLSADGDTTDALLVKRGRIAAIGSEALENGDGAELLEPDPDAACLFPALADAHVHLWGLGLRSGTVDLRDASAPEEIYRRLRSFDPADSPSGWVLGTGWDQHDWEGARELSLEALDQIFPDLPVALWRVDKHALWVNSEALRRAGLGSEFRLQEGGWIGRDERGQLTGLLVDDAMDPVLAMIPEPTVEEDRETFLDSARMLHSHGITAAHIAWMPIDRIPMLQALRDGGELPLRIALMLDAKDPGLEEVLARGPRHDSEGWLSTASVKFFADGALGSQGADVLGGYKDGSRGLVLTDAEELARRCERLAADGWQPAVHAIGDAAARRVLDAFSRIPAELRRHVRPRLEHAEMVDPADVPRFRELDTVASIQPIHLHSDAVWAPEVLDERQLESLFPWRDMAVYTTFAAGSDFPIEDPNPWHGIATAMSRRDKNGAPFSAEQSLTASEILHAYTTGAAFAAHREKILGRLDPGYMADFIALDRDPLTEKAEAIRETRVLGTWLAGENVF